MTKALRLSAAAVVLVVLGVVVQSSVSESSKPCEPARSTDSTGIALGSGYTALSQPEIDKIIEDIRDSGSDWIRFDFDWSFIESTKGTFDWSGTDRLVEAAKATGLHVLGLMTYTPEWARDPSDSEADSHSRPADPTSFGHFAGIAAERYTDSVSAWEIWNEPNLQSFFNPVPDVSFYSELLTAASTSIKKVQPNATIVSGGLSPATDNGTDISPTTFLSDLYDAGAGSQFDVVGMHPYSYPALPSDALTQSWNSFYRMRFMHDTMVTNGDTAKSIWATEFGSPTGSSPEAVTKAVQAEILRDGINEARRLGFVSKLFVYSLQDRGSDLGDREQNFGLLDTNSDPKPAMTVLENANKTGGCF
ncbi:cellulase family glycosylhydrolase [Rhodococcus sp. IEGM 1379]|uniref:GH39 family glycosyl hydrolase n=1 Tax=Rhodococcus sp. IEGM 1379 TaxID=3047086 RepID=UPI0024B75FCE|nr:cellulase family glycosylhydrolase [Rhodococcus sp. IEGM 1379]MDI9917078.1 beta-xylosidase [Rhodococcus sp. IEGM 1379]